MLVKSFEVSRLDDESFEDYNFLKTLMFPPCQELVLPSKTFIMKRLLFNCEENIQSQIFPLGKNINFPEKIVYEQVENHSKRTISSFDLISATFTFIAFLCALRFSSVSFSISFPFLPRAW
jgi:hypothetical protein